MATYKRWRDIRAKSKSPARLARIARAVEQELLEMDLRALRELLGKSQAEIARLAEMTQSEFSRYERRDDHLISTLKRIVTALGGELEVIANFGDKRIRLHAA